MACVCLAAQLYLTLCNPIDRSLPGSSVHGDSIGKNTGVDYHTIPQGIFPTQGLRPRILWLLLWQADSLPLASPGKPTHPQTLLDIYAYRYWNSYQFAFRYKSRYSEYCSSNQAFSKLLLYSVPNIKIMNRWRKTQFRPDLHVTHNLVKGTWEINNQFSCKIILWLLDYAASWWQNPCLRKVSWEIILEKPPICPAREHSDQTIPCVPTSMPHSPSTADTGLATTPRLAGGDISSCLLAHEQRGHVRLTRTVGQKPLDLFPGLGHCSLAPDDGLQLSSPTSPPECFRVRTDINPVFPVRKLYLPFLNLIAFHLRRGDGCCKRAPVNSSWWKLTVAIGDAGQDWRREERGTTEDKMIGWHHRLDAHEFEQAPGDSEGQGSLECCSPWDWKQSDMNWTPAHGSCFLEVRSGAEVTQKLQGLGDCGMGITEVA